MKTLAVPMVLCRFQWQSEGRSLKVCEFPTRWEMFPNGLGNSSRYGWEFQYVGFCRDFVCFGLNSVSIDRSRIDVSNHLLTGENGNGNTIVLGVSGVSCGILPIFAAKKQATSTIDRLGFNSISCHESER